MTTPARDPRPGWQTTEFWLTSLSMVCALVLALTSKVSGEVAIGVIGGGSGVYAITRGVVKK